MEIASDENFTPDIETLKLAVNNKDVLMALKGNRQINALSALDPELAQVLQLSN